MTYILCRAQSEDNRNSNKDNISDSIRISSRKSTPGFKQSSKHNNKKTDRSESPQDRSMSSYHDDNQRGGVDEVKNFEYSFNPKIDPKMVNALVPYSNKKYHPLEKLVPENPASEISKELIHDSTYKIIRKIMEKSHYDFDNPKKINLKKLQRQNKIDPMLLTSIGTPIGYRSATSSFSNLPSTTEHHILRKQLKKQGHTLGPLQTIQEGKIYT